MKPGRFSYYSQFEEIANSGAKEEEGTPKLMGLVFMRKDQELTAKHILPSLSWFHERSGEHIHFVLAGWGFTTDGASAAEPGRTEWNYSDEAFSNAVRVIEENSTWRYQGGTELLLFTVQTKETVHNRADEHRVGQVSSAVDFSSSIALQLDILKERKLIDSIERFFEIIFRFAKTYKGDDPIRALTVQEMRVSLANGISKMLMSIIPKESKEKAEYAVEFAVKDLSRAQHKPMIRIKSEGEQVGMPL